MTNLQTILEQYDDNLFNEAEGFEEAVIGVEEESRRLIYSEREMIRILRERDSMSYQEAREFLAYNTFGTYGRPNDLPIPIWCRDADLEY